MNKIKLFAMVGLFACTLVVTPAAGETETGAVVVGARMYSGHSAIDDYIFAEDDLSYLLGYEIRNEVACLQGLVGYAPTLSATNAAGVDTLDYAITPEINLLATEKYDNFSLHGGGGILMSYYSDEVEGEDWADFYWHLILGCGYTLGAFEIRGQALYTYSDWASITDYEFDDMEYGVLVAYSF